MSDYTIRIGDPSEWATGDLDFFSDWSNATGQTDAALLDDSKWSSQNEGSQLSEIIAATGLGFPAGMDNVFRGEITNVGGSNAYHQIIMTEAGSTAAVPAVGEYQYERFYIRFGLDNGFDPGYAHFIHHGGGSGVYDSWWTTMSTVSSSQVMFGLVLNANQANEFEAAEYFDVDHTYRIELRIERLTSSTAFVQMRAYNESGTKVYDSEDDDWRDLNNMANPVRTDGSDIALNDADDYFKRREMGPNDSVVSGTERDNFIYVGGYALRTSDADDDWIGAYPLSGVEN